VFKHVGGKPPHFDGTCYDYWKRKMKMYLGSINEKVWEVVENDFVVLYPTRPTPRKQAMQYYEDRMRPISCSATAGIGSCDRTLSEEVTGRVDDTILCHVNVFSVTGCGGTG